MKHVMRYIPYALGAAAAVLLGLAGLRAWEGWQAAADTKAGQAEIERLEVEVRRLREAAARPEIEIQGEGQKAPWVLPTEAPRLALIRHLEEVAHTEGVDIDGVELPDRVRVDRVRARVRATGRPDRLIRFLRSVETAREVLVFSRVRMEVDEHGVVHLDAVLLAHGRTPPAARPESTEDAHG